MASSIPRCEVIPVADHQASFTIDGQERLRWHYGPNYPRPFLYPVVGPSGSSLTRMGHPGAPDHDHHQSVWFAHNKVLGIDFWGNQSTARIRQKQWLCYQDSDHEAIMAVLLGWYDGHDPRELLQQEAVIAVRPADKNETLIEIQSTFRPTSESLEFGKTNFGFLAVRMAKSISAHFGGGQLTNSEGATGEPAIFGRPAKWMDYSGSIATLRDGHRESLVEGITYFDHGANPGQPTHWHVREDGWMGAAPCLNAAIVTSRTKPLMLRYLLHAHRGPVDPARAAEIAKQFSNSAHYVVQKSTRKHLHFEVSRQG